MKRIAPFIAYLSLAGVLAGCAATVDIPGAGGLQSGSGSAAPVVAAQLSSSTWLGTNLGADVFYADVTHHLNPFSLTSSQVDANGYPLAGVSGTSSTDIGWELPTGTYKISYVGTGAVTVSGIGTLTGSWQTVNGEHRNEVQITGTPGSFGNFLNLAVTNGAGQNVTSLHLYYPGQDYDSTAVFIPQFLALLSPFRAMRFMDFMNTNGSTVVNWTDRPSYSTFGHSANGEPYEDIYLLANTTGKDLWINIPQSATDDYVTQLATFLSTNLNFEQIAAARAAQGVTQPFQLILEYSNETWNGGFSAYNAILTLANANSSRYDGAYSGTLGPSWMSTNASLMKVGQYEADRLVQIGSIFRNTFSTAGKPECVQTVLSGWAIGAAYSEVALEFVAKNYGTPSTFINYIAIAPYFSTADDTTTGSLATLFPALETGVQSSGAAFPAFQSLSTEYGIPIAAYEGGQGLSGATNVDVKNLAQQDARMYTAYQNYFAMWKQYFGKSLFMHFSLAGGLGTPENILQYGFWGSILSVTLDPTQCGKDLPTLSGSESWSSVSHFCPKYEFLQEQAGD